MPYKYNPKALKLDGLADVTRKVTIGFKCHAKIKLQLASDAKKVEMTLSEYVECLVQDYISAVQLEKQENEQLKQRISFYENDVLMRLFKKYRNKTETFTNTKGVNIELFIKEPKDMYTIIVNSYKLKK